MDDGSLKLEGSYVATALFLARATGHPAHLALWLGEHRRVSAPRKRKRRTSASCKMQNSVRSRMWAALKGRNDAALFARLGYGIDDLRAHLERLFVSGMTWSNYGRWHVDHKRPCSSFDLTDSAQFAMCWSLNNLQPLWASDNIKKGSSYG